jgi:hypothetical protein
VRDKTLLLAIFPADTSKDIHGTHRYTVASALSLTPRFSEVKEWGKYENRFNGFPNAEA